MDEVASTWKTIFSFAPDSSIKLHDGGLQFLKDMENYEWPRYSDSLYKRRIIMLKCVAIEALWDSPEESDYFMSSEDWHAYCYSMYEWKLASTHTQHLISIIVCVLVIIRFVYGIIIDFF